MSSDRCLFAVVIRVVVLAVNLYFLAQGVYSLFYNNNDQLKFILFYFFLLHQLELSGLGDRCSSCFDIR